MTTRAPRPMTRRQTEILDWIKAFIEARGYPPTFREIGEMTGIVSPNGVMCHLKSLELKGKIRRDPLVSRGIVVLPEVSE